jgi:hypothetical protein
MMPKLWLLVPGVLILFGCQQAPVYDETSPYSRIPVGSRIVLQEALEVPKGHTRVFLQHGKTLAKHQLNQYYPHCNFEVRAVSDGSTRIKPDTFFVTAVAEGEEMVVKRESPFRHVGLGMFDDSQSMITRLVHYRLGSESQPAVTRLTCHGGFAEPYEADYPGIGDVRDALGKLASVGLAVAL